MPTPRTKTPRIRSMPGQVYQVTTDDLTELRLRHQAILMQRATMIMMQKGHVQHIQELLARYGIDPEGDDSKFEWAINLDTGEIVHQRKGVEVVDGVKP